MKFSVLMSVYGEDDASFLHHALCSIWDEQSIRPDQVVLVKDGPLTTELSDTIDFWQDKLSKQVMTVISLTHNLGLGAALNEGLKACCHDLVARMDSDDVSFDLRFEKQLVFMKQNPDVVASSAQVEEWNEDLSVKLGVRKIPCKFEDIYKMSRFRSPLSHPVVIFRKKVINELGGYPGLRKGQDYALWSLLLKNGYLLGNIPDVLLKMRAGSGLFERRGWEYFKSELELLDFQLEIGFLSFFGYVRNVSLKAFLRISPVFIKRLAYKMFR